MWSCQYFRKVCYFIPVFKLWYETEKGFIQNSIISTCGLFSPKAEYNCDLSLSFITSCDRDLSISIRAWLTMTTNKERIENLEVGLGGLQDGMSQMKITLVDRMHQMEANINKLTEALLSNKERSSSQSIERNGQPRHQREEFTERTDRNIQMFSSKMAKLEFPIYSGNDPTEWFNIVDQFFEYQGTAETQKVSLASFHLQREAN